MPLPTRLHLLFKLLHVPEPARCQGPAPTEAGTFAGSRSCRKSSHRDRGSALVVELGLGDSGWLVGGGGRLAACGCPCLAFHARLPTLCCPGPFLALFAALGGRQAPAAVCTQHAGACRWLECVCVCLPQPGHAMLHARTDTRRVRASCKHAPRLSC